MSSISFNAFLGMLLPANNDFTLALGWPASGGKSSTLQSNPVLFAISADVICLPPQVVISGVFNGSGALAPLTFA